MKNKPSKIAFAAIAGLTSPLGDPANGGDLKVVFTNILSVVQTFMIMASVLYLLYAGFMFVIARGDPTKLQKAKAALLWGLVGVALILAAEVLAYGLGDTVKSVFTT